MNKKTILLMTAVLTVGSVVGDIFAANNFRINAEGQPSQFQPGIQIGAVGYQANTNVVPATNNLTVKLVNPKAAIFRDIKVTAQVTKRDGTKVFTKAYPTIVMAPNSNIIFNITNKKVLTAGRYVVNITVQGNHKTWTTKEAFKLSQNKQGKLTLISEKLPIPIWFYLIGSAGILMLVVGLMLIQF